MRVQETIQVLINLPEAKLYTIIKTENIYTTNFTFCDNMTVSVLVSGKLI
jgi:hypothetical protein